MDDMLTGDPVFQAGVGAAVVALATIAYYNFRAYLAERKPPAKLPPLTGPSPPPAPAPKLSLDEILTPELPPATVPLIWDKRAAGIYSTDHSRAVFFTATGHKTKWVLVQWRQASHTSCLKVRSEDMGSLREAKALAEFWRDGHYPEKVAA